MITRVEQVHMAMTLRRRKRWVRPHGTGVCEYYWREGLGRGEGGGECTVSVVVEVEELVAPLGHNPYGIFDECAYDQEPSYCWNVTANPIFMLACQSSAIFNTSNSSQDPPFRAMMGEVGHSRFYRIRSRIQPLLNLIRLLPKLVQRTRIVCSV